jgi:PAS domain S-box-containing protein
MVSPAHPSRDDRSAPPASAPGLHGNERLEAIIDIQQRIAAAGFDARAIMDVVATHVARLVGATGIGLGLVQGDFIVYRPTDPTAQTETTVSLTDSLSGRCIASRTAFRCDDTETDPRVARDGTRAVGVRSLLIVPLCDENTAIGTLGAMSPAPHAFTDEDLRTLELLGGILAAALRHAFAYEEKVRLIADRTAALERLRAILNTEPDCVKVVDRQGRLVDMNPAGLAILEVDSIDEVKGESLASFVLPEYRDAFAALHEAVFEGRSSALEFELRGARGTVRRAQTRAVPLRDDKGRITAELAITRDVTEQHAAAEALRESEAKFSGIVSIAADAIVALDDDLRIVLFNNGAEQTFGYRATEVVGQPHAMLLPDWAHGTHESLIRGFTASGSGPRLMSPPRPVTARRKNGEEFPAEASVARVEVNGKALYAAVLRDVSERRRTETLLAARARQQATVAQLGRDALRSPSLDTLIDQATRAVAETLDVEFCQIVEVDHAGGAFRWRSRYGWPTSALGPHTILEPAGGRSDYTIRAGTPVISENIVTEHRFHVAGTLRELGAVSGISVVIQNGDRPFGVLSADTTRRRAFTEEDVNFLQAVANLVSAGIERRRGEEALRASEVRFRTTLEHSSDLLLFIDGGGTIQYASPSYERGLGYVPSELVGRSVINLIHLEDAWRIEDLLREIQAADGAAASLELRAAHQDGSYRTLSVGVLNLLHDPLVGFIVVTGRDVTTERALEAQLRQSQKMEAVGQLAGGVAHDFNNMLTVIIAHAGLLLSQTVQADERYESITEIGGAAERASSLTRQLLAFSRKQLLHPQALDLDAVIHGLEPMLRRLIIEDIRVDVRSVEDGAWVLADRGQIEQVIINLAVNARDAMPRGGALGLETALVHIDERAASGIPGLHAGRYIALTVRDTGVGMSSEIRDRMFEPFFTTKEAGSGTGLGLSTVYGIVQQSGGGITVDTAPGLGTTFVVYLPYASRDAIGDEAGASMPSTVTPPTHETILLVEDAAPVRLVAKRVLESRGYRILEAGNGREGLAIAAAHVGAIDLVVSDVVMPEMDGRLMVETLRRERPGVSVLFMSGYTDDEVLRRGLGASDQGFLQKPFTQSSLVEAVDVALRARPAAHGGVADP